jgi:hypothetical protein
VTGWNIDNSTRAIVVDFTPEEVDFACPPGHLPGQEEVQLARKAVCVHAREHWQHGDFCVNCRAPFPCRLHRWGRRVLTAGGWTDREIVQMIEEFARTGAPSWQEPTRGIPLPRNPASRNRTAAGVRQKAARRGRHAHPPDAP